MLKGSDKIQNQTGGAHKQHPPEKVSCNFLADRIEELQLNNKQIKFAEQDGKIRVLNQA